MLQKPKLKEMVLAVREQGFQCPDDLPRAQIERRYYLVIVCKETMLGRAKEQQCFGHYAHGEEACQKCTIHKMCEEMMATQQTQENTGKALEPVPSTEAPSTSTASEPAPVEGASAPVAVEQVAADTAEAEPKAKKPRTSDPEKLDEFGFRQGTTKSLIATALVSMDGKPRKEVVAKIKEVSGLNDKQSELRFHNVKGELVKKCKLEITEEGDEKILKVIRKS
jgi:hypothetical protein